MSIFNNQELKALLQLIDIAIRAEGLKTSQVGSHLANKIDQELKQNQEKPEPDKPKPDKQDKKKDKDN